MFPSVSWALADSAPAANATPLRFGLSEALDSPLITWQPGQVGRQLQGGLLPELHQELAKRLQRPPQTVLVARKRVALAVLEGETDLHCYQTPEWFGPLAGKVQWSVPLFTVHNRIIRQASAPAINTLDDLRGHAVGTTLGYFYPTLEPYFRDGRIRRADAGSERQGFRKFMAGRLDFLVMNSLSLDWHLREWAQRLPGTPMPISTPLVFDPVEVRCALSPALSLQAVNRVIDSMRADDSLDAILQRYR
ncbi:MAG: substrate-binding periplasmic protein [Pseudomonadota bacterium]